MTKRVLKAMIILVVAFLLIIYVAKIFFPNWLVLQVSNPRLIKFGNYVDNHWWADLIATFITAFVTYWLYLCAVCRKWKLNKKEIAIVLVAILLNYLVELYLLAFALHFSISIMLLLPLLFKAELKSVAFVFVIHGFAQILSLEIRHIGVLIPSFNFASFMILSIDMYIWLVLLYLISNKKENNNGK